MNIRHYRFLLLASVFIGIFGGVVDFIFPALMPESFHLAQKDHDESLSLLGVLASLFVGIFGLALFIASFYGLFKFRIWAPRLAVFSTALLLLCLPFMGTLAQSGLAISLSYLASYLWGAALILSYIQPISSHFKGGQDG